MSDEPLQLSDIFKLWVEHPLTQSWIRWQKWMWAGHPLSRLIPLDTEEMWRAFTQLGEDLTARPEVLKERTEELLRRYNELAVWGLRQYLGQEQTVVAPANQKDSRFQDEAWTSNLALSTLKQAYLVLSNWLMSTAQETPGLDPKTRQRVNFYVRQFVDAMSPANFWLTNPTAWRETLETGGENLRQGMENLLEDFQRGDIRMASKDHFKLGVNLAVTPGQVIFRNELIELIQYSPASEQVYRIPLLIIPPWINRFYIMDIRPGRSMIEYLVAQGYTVFMISWKNVDAALENLVMEDYMRLGPLTAMQVVKAITGEPQVNLLGYCIGGTLLAILLAYLAAAGDHSAHTGTFFTALQDFSDVGETSIFITQEWLEVMEKWVHPKGYVDGSEIGSIFRLMRDNDLIWNYVVNNYLLGKEPLNFDLIYWSSHGTRMPARFHADYLRNYYMENNLVKPNCLQMLGRGIDLGRVTLPCYVVAGQEDHIVLWRTAHRARALFSGPTRLILGYGGHIGSIINPPSAGKGFYYSNPSDTTDPDQWLKTAERRPGSWWPDWNVWLGAQSGERVAPPPLGSADYPPLVAAPGRFVLED
jgi:polyhydroxyalkanoate synthase subunit PhaC